LEVSPKARPNDTRGTTPRLTTLLVIIIITNTVRGVIKTRTTITTINPNSRGEAAITSLTTGDRIGARTSSPFSAHLAARPGLSLGHQPRKVADRMRGPEPPIPPVRARLVDFRPEWECITQDQWVLDTVGRGFSIEFLDSPPPPSGVRHTPIPKDPTQASAL